jgi:hypothetical protein
MRSAGFTKPSRIARTATSLPALICIFVREATIEHVKSAIAEASGNANAEPSTRIGGNIIIGIAKSCSQQKLNIAHAKGQRIRMPGLGDELMASSLARGAADGGERVAFGDKNRQIWSAQSHLLFAGNPNIAPLGTETAGDIWIPHYRGHRLYGEVKGNRWVFRDCEWQPGEVFLTKEEKAFALSRVWGSDPIAIIEPRVKPVGACAGANKDWGRAKYQELASRLLAATGMRLAQLVPKGQKPLLADVDVIETPSFRHALAVLGLAQLYIGPEGGLHHGAAAMGTPAVVIFGGFNTPRATGYAWHENITVGEPCGSVAACRHCADAMASISVDRVLEGAMRQLGQREAA